MTWARQETGDSWKFQKKKKKTGDLYAQKGTPNNTTRGERCMVFYDGTTKMLETGPIISF